MKKGLGTFLAIAGMLGIGGTMPEAQAIEPRQSEPEEKPFSERNERIVMRSRDDQARKRARRQDRHDKSEAGKNR